MKNNKLYTVNRGNQPFFAHKFAIGGLPLINGYNQGVNFGGIGFPNTPVSMPALQPQIGGLDPKNMQPLADVPALKKSKGLNLGGIGLGAIGAAVGGVAGNAIRGGFDDGGIGSGIQNVGGQIASALPGPIGGIVGVGTGLIGGLVSRMFGVKENKENTNFIKQNTQNATNMGNTLAGSTDNMNLVSNASKMVGGSGFNWEDLYQNGWFTSKGTRLGNNLIAKENTALAIQSHGLGTGAENVDSNMDRNVLRNFAAFGGYMDARDNLFALGSGMDISDEDTRSDTTRQGYHEGTIPYGAGLGQAGEFPLYSLVNEIDRQTNAFREDSPMYNPGLQGGIAPLPTKATNAAEALQMVKAMKAAKMAKSAKVTSNVKRGSSFVGKSPEEIEAIRAARSAAGRKAAELRNTNGPTEDYLHRFDAARERAAKREAMRGMHQANKDATAILGKSGSAFRRKSNGSVYSWGAQNVNWIDDLGDPLFAFGGELGTNGTDFTNGLLHVDEGGSHEKNPLGGIPMGVDDQGIPNLVEEDETVFNNYVFSNRMKVPKAFYNELGLGGTLGRKGITFAEASKKLSKESEQRPNDPLSMDGLEDSMARLAAVQEAERMKKQAKEYNTYNDYAYGGSFGNMFEGKGSKPNTLNLDDDIDESIVRRIFGDTKFTRGFENTAEFLDDPANYMFGDQIEAGMNKLAQLSEPELEKFFNTSVGRQVANIIVSSQGGGNAQEAGVQRWAKSTGRLVKPVSKAVVTSAKRAMAQSKQLAKQQMKTTPKGAGKVLRETKTPIQTAVETARGGANIPAGYSTNTGPASISGIGSGVRTPMNNAYAGSQALKPELSDWGEGLAGSLKMRMPMTTGQKTAALLGATAAGGIGAGLLESNLGNNTGNRNVFASNGYNEALQWVNEKYPEAENKEAIASAMAERIKKMPEPLTNAYSDVMKGYSNFRSPLGTDSEDRIRKHYKELTDLGMDPEVAFDIAYPKVDEKLNEPGKSYSDIPRYRRESAKRSAMQTQLLTETEMQRRKDNAAASPNGNRATNPTTGAPEASIPGNNNGAQTNPNNIDRSGNAPTRARMQVQPLDISSLPENKAANPFSTNPFDTLEEKVKNTPVIPLPSEATVKGRPQQPQDLYAPSGVMDNTRSYPTWMRYAPAVGSGIMSISDMLGLTNTPDYTEAQKIEDAADRAANFLPATFTPVGDYIKYNPLDIWYEQNRMNANARATDRAIANSTNPSKAAALLASGYNSQIASGDLYRKALEYNDAKRSQVADFNRRTNMFNSQMGLEAAMANSRARQQAEATRLSGIAQAAAMRDSIDARMGAARSANLSNFLDSLGNIGRENFIMNQINGDDAYRYGIDSSGYIPIKRKRGGRINKK